MNINEHPVIPSNVFADLVKFFGAIDTNLSLHYSNHTTDPSLDKILDSAARLLGRRITTKDLLCILCISPKSFVIANNIKLNENSEHLISIPPSVSINSFNQQIPKRKVQFITEINSWIEKNNELSSIPSIPLERVINKRKLASSKIIKPNLNSPSPTKRLKSDLVNELKNDPSKFTFKSKDEELEKQKSNGLSLLERIRLKEKLINEQLLKESPEMKYTQYIQSKLVPIYDIIFQIHRYQQKDNLKSYPLTKLISMVSDSLNYPVSKDEIKDVIYLIETRLTKEKLQIISRSGVTAVKVIKLNREDDLKLLK